MEETQPALPQGEPWCLQSRGSCLGRGLEKVGRWVWTWKNATWTLNHSQDGQECVVLAQTPHAQSQEAPTCYQQGLRLLNSTRGAGLCAIGWPCYVLLRDRFGLCGTSDRLAMLFRLLWPCGLRRTCRLQFWRVQSPREGMVQGLLVRRQSASQLHFQNKRLTSWRQYAIRRMSCW